MSHIGVNLGFGNLHEKLTDEQMYAGELGLAEFADQLPCDIIADDLPGEYAAAGPGRAEAAGR